MKNLPICLGNLSLMILLLTNVSLTIPCTKTGPCSCTNSQGTLDLSPLLNNYGIPRFDFIAIDGKDLNEVYYMWHPCNSFDVGPIGAPDACVNVAVCQFHSNGYYDIGLQSNVEFTDGGSNDVMMLYTTTSTARQTYVKLICDPNKEADINGLPEYPDLSYHIELRSRYACFLGSGPGPNPDPGNPHVEIEVDGLSIGSIITILFFVLLFVYTTSGILFLKFYKKAEGKEIIPNKAFWVVLPGFIKDGFIFTYQGIKHKCGGYEKV